jgi:hypothetical protein
VAQLFSLGALSCHNETNIHIANWYRHWRYDFVGLLQSVDPKQIAEMVTLKRRTTDVVFHLVYPDGHLDAVALRGATLEKHKDYEVLYVK